MSSILIKNAVVYNHRTGDFSPQDVLIQEQKIQAMIKASEKEARSADTVIDAQGCYLTPGFIDTCSQIGLKETGIRWEGNDSYEPSTEQMHQLQVVDGIYPFDQAFQDAVASGVTAAHVLSSAETVAGAQTAVLHTFGTTVDEMILHKHLGYSFSMGDVPKKAHWEKFGTPLTRMGIAHQIRTTLQEIQKKASLEATPFFIRCHRADDIATALRIAEDFQLHLVLVHATEFSKVLHSGSSLPYAVVGGPCFQPMERGELRYLDPALYQQLFEAKISCTLATDHPVSSVKHLQLEGSLAFKAGVPPEVVLNQLTWNAAQLLKIDHLTGSIEEGLFADLVLWDGHPLNLTTRAVRTFIKGKEVYRKG